MEEEIKELQDIRSIMERYSKFISLSGLSGISVGVIACIAVAFAYFRPFFFEDIDGINWNNASFRFLIIIALSVFILSFLAAYYFTQRRTLQKAEKLWSGSSKRMLANLLIPISVGGVFCMFLVEREPTLLPSASLLFYGLSLINASKYTIGDIRNLGFCEIFLGIFAGVLAGRGYDLLFLGLGFGLLHIIYGALVYKKYEA